MIVGDTYTVVVQAPDVAPDLRPWLVRAFRASDREAIASCSHHSLDDAASEVFAAVRADIGTRMDRGIAFGTNDAPHEGAGSSTYYDVDPDHGLTTEQLDAWLLRVTELIGERPELDAHSRRNEAGEFDFSPATCPLCRTLADIEVQARADVLAAAAPAGATS